ncbi:hypothetical protein L1887_25300 [Cichorium endivia]|nr:hypothetical protein L1887_25300 [Cichorium endivia]
MILLSTYKNDIMYFVTSCAEKSKMHVWTISKSTFMTPPVASRQREKELHLGCFKWIPDFSVKYLFPNKNLIIQSSGHITDR